MSINEKIIDIDIKDEMKKSYIDYAMSVIVSRALPDVRDGLKPVHRRILYAMHELGFTHEKQHRKSARIVGEVLGKYHPHGDSSVYNAMVRLAQPFSTRNMLVDGHGNFGSIDGDSAAAMRYTEARMTKLTSELLKDIDKKTVNFSPNFDETENEPTVMPSRYPNLLVNGSNGIAVGMATSIPPHNLGEVIDATIHLINNPEATVDDLINFIEGPDFPTGANIMGHSGIIQGYRTGRGRAVVRSEAEIVETKRGKTAIIVSEIPYLVNKSKMLEDIADLVRNKKIDGITDLRDESDRNGIRVVIELRKDANPNVVLNHLYKHTQLQSTFSMNMIALVGGQPKLLNLHDMISYYIKHQIEVETRRVQFDLAKAAARAHILEGLIIALDNIDEIIKLIRGSQNTPEAKAALIERFGLSEKQAQAILDMRLNRLTGLERDKIEAEYQELLKTMNYLNGLLADENLLLDVIKEDLVRIKDKYADERRTKITFNFDEIDMEDLIDREDVTITMTHNGYIKRVPVDTYATQKRGGRGKTGLSTREDDFVEDIFTTSTHDYLMFFTNFGKVYRLKAYQIPDANRLAKGTAIVNLLQLDVGESVSAVIPIKEFNDGYLVLLTRNGVIKKTDLTMFDTSRKSGLIAINLRENDELIDVKHTSGEEELIIVTTYGKAIRFKESDVRDMGRTAMGVRGIELAEGDRVVGLERITLDSKLLVVSENGYGKRTSLGEYRTQIRGGKGIKTYNNSEKTGNIVGAKVVSEEDNIILINSNGIIIRLEVNEISITGRSTSGVRLMRLEEDVKLVSVAKVVDNEDPEDDTDESGESNESVEKIEAPQTEKTEESTEN